MKVFDSRAMLLLWCAVLTLQVFFCSTTSAASVRSATTAPAKTNLTSSSESTSASGTPAISESASASASDTVNDATSPIGTVAAATTTKATSATATATATPSATVNTAYVCNADEIARLKKLNSNNPYLQSECSSSAGIGSYVFPFNGKLTYAQLVAMSRVNECGLYFRAVLLVQLSECEVANIYIRTTAETVLQLANTSSTAPTEAELNSAVEVRRTYNLALRDGNGSASYAATSGASSLSWNIEGDTIDTTTSANVEGQLLLSSDLHIIGTFYASSASSKVDGSRTSDQTISKTNGATRRGSSWTTTVAIGLIVLLYMK